MATILDKLAARARVRVYKSAPRADDRTTLCGEELEQGKDADGNDTEFWTIPAHQGDYINGAFNQYTVSEPFLPGEEPAGDIAKPLIGEEGFPCQFPGCDFNAKSELGRLAHERSHTA